MKKAFWWILGILLSPILLFVILLILLYLPPVQNWAVDKVASMASESTGMEITVGHVNLSFPLDLAVDDVQVLTASSAPLARIERAVGEKLYVDYGAVRFQILIISESGDQR